MEKKLDTILSVIGVMLVLIVMLASPAVASGEPSREPGMEMESTEPSAEPFREMPSYSGAEVLAGVLMDAAGLQSAENAADMFADMDTAAVAEELCSLLDMTKLMTDEQLRAQIVSLAAGYGYSFTEGELEAIIAIIRSFEPLTVDELQTRLGQMQKGYMTAEEIRDGLNSLGDRVHAFIQKIIELFRIIFSKDGMIFAPA